MKLKLIMLGIVVALQVFAISCSTKKMAAGDSGVIEAKDQIFAAVDRKSFEAFAKASAVDDKVDEVKLMTQGQIFTVSPGTKVKVLASYEYEGYLGYQVKLLDGRHEGEEAYVNFAYVKPSSE